MKVLTILINQESTQENYLMIEEYSPNEGRGLIETLDTHIKTLHAFKEYCLSNPDIKMQVGINFKSYDPHASNLIKIIGTIVDHPVIYEDLDNDDDSTNMTGSAIITH